MAFRPGHPSRSTSSRYHHRCCDPKPPREFIARQWGLLRGGVFTPVQTLAYVRPEAPPTDAFVLLGALAHRGRAEYAVLGKKMDNFASYNIYRVGNTAATVFAKLRAESGFAEHSLANTPYDQGDHCRH